MDSDSENIQDDMDAHEKKLKTIQGDFGESSSDDEPHQVYQGTLTETNRLKAKIDMLMGDVISKDNEISALKSTMEAMSTSSGGNINEKKLLQLSKENKSLRVEISKEQSRARQATEELKKLKNKVREPASKKGWSSAASSMLQEEEWKNKYRETEKLYQDAKFKHYAVKQELKKAMKVIQREVGNDATNLDALANNDSWRGRAQTITLLQSKLNDMKRKMATATKNTTSEGFAPPSVRASPPQKGKADERRK